MDIGEKLKRLREEKGLTLRELAEEADANISTISRVENGLRGISLPIAARIADFFDVSVDWLIDDNQDYPPPSESITPKKGKRQKV